MSIRAEVSAFVQLVPLPKSRDAGQEQIKKLEEALNKITPPISREEAIALATVFGPDDCFGLAWSVVHLIESTPGEIPLDEIPQSENQWIVSLRHTAARTAALKKRSN